METGRVPLGVDFLQALVERFESVEVLRRRKDGERGGGGAGSARSDGAETA